MTARSPAERRRRAGAQPPTFQGRCTGCCCRPPGRCRLVLRLGQRHDGLGQRRPGRAARHDAAVRGSGGGGGRGRASPRGPRGARRMRDITLGETFYSFFTTRAFATGVPTTLAGTPALSVREENNATPITAGVSVSVDRASV